MALQTQGGTGMSPSDAYTNARSIAFNVKIQAQNLLATMQSGTVGTTTIFQMLDVLANVIAQLTTCEAVTGLNAWATSQGYSGTFATDCASVITAAESCVSWTVTNFPVDSSGFLQAQKLNANGTRTDNQFTTAQTAGLQTNLQAFIQTIA